MMSLFSRLFRKAPASSVPAPPSESRPERSEGNPPKRQWRDGERPAAEVAAARVPEPKPDRALAAATEEKALQSAIEQQDVATIARFVVGGTSTKVRQRAAQAVEDPEVLRQLIRDVRGGNDKSVYKILTSKRDALHAEERKLEHLRAQISAVAAALERHSQRSFDPLYAATLDQLENRWKAVASDASAETLKQAQQSIDRAREVVAAHLRQIAAEASRELAAANAAAEAQRIRELEARTAAAAAAEQARIAEAERRAEGGSRRSGR